MLARLNFEFPALVKEMLDQLPKWVWTSETTTFLDPSMGGGQFVKEIEKRLREAGHSDDNISKRVFGFEKNILRVNFSVYKNKLVGTYYVLDFLSWEPNMKFDVIVGNPPYQNPVRSNANTNQGGGQKLYIAFMKNSSKLLKPNGVLAFCVPSAIFKTTVYGQFGKAISSMENMKIFNAVTDVSEHFSVGIKIAYFLSKKTNDSVEATINDDPSNFNSIGFHANETELQSIAEKLLTNRKPITIYRDKDLSGIGITTSRFGYLEFDKKSTDTNLCWEYDEPEKLKRLLKTNMFARVAWDGFVILDKRWYHNFWSALYVDSRIEVEMTDDEIMDLYGLSAEEKLIVNKIDRTSIVK